MVTESKTAKGKRASKRILGGAGKRSGENWAEVDYTFSRPTGSSSLGETAILGVVRKREFGGRRPYRFQDERQSASGRWEIWMDSRQADRKEFKETAAKSATSPELKLAQSRADDGNRLERVGPSQS